MSHTTQHSTRSPASSFVQATVREAMHPVGIISCFDLAAAFADVR